MKPRAEIDLFLEHLQKIIGVRLRLVSPLENNKLEDYIQEAPTVLTSYLYNRFYKLNIPKTLNERNIIHLRHSLGIENIYIPLEKDYFITMGPFTSNFLSADDIEGGLIRAGLTFSPSLYRFFSQELPILDSERKNSVLALIYQFFDIPIDAQKIITYYLPDENNETPKSSSLTNLAQHEKMHYRYKQSLMFAKFVEEGDFVKCMELLKSSLKYQISEHYSDNAQMNETIILSRIGCLLYYASIKGGVTPLTAENIYTKYIRSILSADSVDTVRNLGRTMLETYCDAVKNSKETKYSAVVQKLANYLSLLGGEELNLDELSHIFKTSIRILEKNFRDETGFTIKQYHRNVRLHRAAVLLTETDLPINQIAMQTGFLDQNYFARQFKLHYRCSPSAYRQNAIIN